MTARAAEVCLALHTRTGMVTTVRYTAPQALRMRHWEGEDSAVVRDPGTGATHLIAHEAMAVLEAVMARARGAGLREIAHDMGSESPHDTELEAGVQRIIDGLLQAGLLHRVDVQGVAGGEARP
ncbi:MAG: hypothetical protein JNJ89_14695 [Rubrivivax sp.]|nr:hypothetical protein [Rubrivivax sp.]